MVKKIFVIFLVWRILLYFFAFLATFILPLQIIYTSISGGYNFGVRTPYLVWIWGNFDGRHYMEIARNGYHQFEHAFFPLYPILIKLLLNLVSLTTKYYLRYIVSSQIISNFSFFLSLFIIGKILVLDRKRRLFPLVLFTIIFFPTSVFYAAAYNDSLFFLLATLTIYFSRRQYWVLASITGGLATLTRFNGLALLPLVFFEYISNKKKNLSDWNARHVLQNIKEVLTFQKILRGKIYTIILIPLSFAAYLVYTQITYKNWYLVFSSLKVWDQDKLVFPLVVFWRYTKILILDRTHPVTDLVSLLELSSVLFYIIAMIYSFKKIRFSYWVFFVVSILIPSLTGTFQGMPRYGLHLYPFFLSVALFLEKKPLLIKLAYFAISATLLFLLTTFFTRGYFIA